MSLWVERTKLHPRLLSRCPAVPLSRRPAVPLSRCPAVPLSRYGTSSDFGCTRTIQRPELMSGT